MKKLLRNNNGSGIAGVVVAGAFLFLLAASVAIGSNYNMRMKQVDSAVRADFYEVDALYERAGVEIEQIVQDAISYAYNEMLKYYEQGREQDLFERYFIETLESKFGNDWVAVNGMLRFNVTDLRSSNPKMVYNQIEFSQIEIDIPDITAEVSLDCPYVLITGESMSGSGAVSGRMYIKKDIKAVRNTLALDGAIYVGDDLQLDGGSVELIGEYYGFGNSKTEGNESSAILIDEQNSTLNLEGLRALYLSGVAFIENGDNEQGSTDDIPIGGSISVRADQLAFIVPSEYVTYDGPESKPLGNPYITATDDEAIKISHVPSGAAIEKFYSSTYESGQIVYLVYKFNSQQQSNAWFKEYCLNNTDKINNYLNHYLSGYKLGSLVPQNDGLHFTVTGTSPNFSFGVAGGESDVTYNEPTDAEIYLGWIGSIPADITVPMEFQDESTGDVLAIVSNEDVTSIPAGCKFVLTSGSVTLTANNFDGIIIAGGSVTLSGNSIVAYTELTDTTLDAEYEDLTLREFLAGISAKGGGGSPIRIKGYTKNGG